MQANKRKIRRYLIGVTLVIGVLAATAAGARPKPVRVETATVTRGALQVALREDGKTRVKNRYLLTAPVAGRLLRPSLQVGMPIREGDLLASIAPAPSPLHDARTARELQERIGAAQADLEFARLVLDQSQTASRLANAEYERWSKLATAGAVTERDLDRARTDAELRKKEAKAAEFRVQAAGHTLEMSRVASRRGTQSGGAPLVIRAPVSGVVLRVLHENEGVVQAGTPLVEIADPSQLEIVVDVLSGDAIKVQSGAHAHITQWGGDLSLEAAVRVVEPVAATKVSALGLEEQRVNVVLDFVSPREAWSRLGDGYRVEAEVVLQEIDDTLLVPVAALFRTGKDWSVFVVKDGRATMRAINVGLRNATQAEVTGGLEAGDEVVLYPDDTIAEGIRVTK